MTNDHSQKIGTAQIATTIRTTHITFYRSKSQHQEFMLHILGDISIDLVHLMKCLILFDDTSPNTVWLLPPDYTRYNAFIH